MGVSECIVLRPIRAHRYHWDIVVQRADLSAQNWLFGSHHPRRYRLEPEWSWALKGFSFRKEP